MIRRIEPKDEACYLRMAAAFYTSPAVSHPVNTENFCRTFAELMRSDTYAEGYIILSGEEPAGYALLAKTYSQEAGGLVVWVEELYIKEAYRGQGLGREFFRYLGRHLPASTRRLRLEMTAENGRAAEMYRRLGFTPLPYLQMLREL